MIDYIMFWSCCEVNGFDGIGDGFNDIGDKAVDEYGHKFNGIGAHGFDGIGDWFIVW